MTEEILINGKKITELSDMFFEYTKLKQEFENLEKRKDRYYIKTLEQERQISDLITTLINIYGIVRGMHDMWINQTPYTDVYNLAEHLLKCELNRVINELDEVLG